MCCRTLAEGCSVLKKDAVMNLGRGAQCVAACCSVLQRAQRVAVCYIVLQSGFRRHGSRQCVAVC